MAINLKLKDKGRITRSNMLYRNAGLGPLLQFEHDVEQNLLMNKTILPLQYRLQFSTLTQHVKSCDTALERMLGSSCKEMHIMHGDDKTIQVEDPFSHSVLNVEINTSSWEPVNLTLTVQS